MIEVAERKSGRREKEREKENGDEGGNRERKREENGRNFCSSIFFYEKGYLMLSLAVTCPQSSIT